MRDTSSPKKSGCLKAAAWGCGLTLTLAVLAVAFVIVNLEYITTSDLYRNTMETISKGKETFSRMSALHSQLIKDYPANEIQIMTNSLNDGTALSIRVVNPAFLPEDEAEWEPKAREIAVVAANHTELMDGVQTVTVVFLHKKGVGFTLTTFRNFPYEKTELMQDRSLSIE